MCRQSNAEGHNPKRRKHKTRREKFFEQLETLVRWERLEALIRPYYPKAGRGRRPYPLSAMLRIHVVQVCYDLSDPAMEDLLYDTPVARRFVGLDPQGPIPDETTILNFRHLLERHELGQALLGEINAYLSEQGVKLKEGTIVDATIINAPPSTKNKAKQRDPEMHQVKKGNQYYFGMKLHIGVDSETGLAHSLAATAANAHDITQTHKLLHGKERVVWGDAGYTGIEKREEVRGLVVEWRIAMKAGKRRKLDPGGEEEAAEKAKASVRAKVEHPFLDVKRNFGYAKVRYRGLAKNLERLALMLGIFNLRRAQRLLAV